MSWEIVKLGDVCSTIKTGKTPPTSNPDYFDGLINWFCPSDIGANQYLKVSTRTITNKAIDDKKAVIYEKNSILLTCIGEIGRCGILKTDASSNQQITAIKFKHFIEPRYGYYWFLHNKRGIEQSANNAVVPILNNAGLRAVEFEYPPLHIQKQIANILDKADALRKKDQQLLQKYDELAQSIFIDMFGDPVKNEKRWEVVELKTIFRSNPRLGTIKPVSDNGDTFVVRVGELGSINIAISRCMKVHLNEVEKERYLLKTDDILLARAIGSLDHLGKASLIQELGQEVVFDSHVMRLQFNQNKIKSLFFYHWLQSKGGRRVFLKSAGKTSVQFNINGEQISKLKIALPDINIQEKFIKLIEHLERTKSTFQHVQTKSEQLFQSLLQKAFTGELI